ncbi:hypothetical protein T484DRAFT_1757028 [Baffinella frigidus]|nr:hypothetical protein T484DRAFT_1757028 [Cryptophyta sp. CCMP2293]
MVTNLVLPNHYKTEIVEIKPTNTERGFDAAAAFCSILDELKAELEESPDTDGFYHNRSSLLKAYGENRMYGLCAYWSEEMLEHQSFNDPIFVTNKHCMIHRMLPCFLVLEKEWDGGISICEKVWVAERARKKGMAKYMLDEFDVRSAENPLPEAEAFWAKHFARVQAEIDENEAEMDENK